MRLRLFSGVETNPLALDVRDCGEAISWRVLACVRCSAALGRRQVWEYDEQGGDMAERVAVEKARAKFKENRFEQRHSSDMLMRLQVSDRTLFVKFFNLLVWFVLGSEESVYSTFHLQGFSREDAWCELRRPLRWPRCPED